MVYPLLKNKVVETNGMIAIMAQWGLTAEELLPAIDKINKVADDFAITSTDLVAGLQRSSGAAKVLGLTMNETIAILTTMREATGRTGKEVGNALNSILSFMQRDKAISTFEDLGIRVFADEAKTQFRNVIEIFDEMAAKWPQMGKAAQDALTSEAEAAGLFSEEMANAVGVQGQWNDLQQRDLSQAAAGVYRRNYLLALLQNWSKVDEVLISQENSLGYSMKENERTMQTLDKQVEVLKASAEQLAVALGDAGLLNELKGLVEGITDAVQWFNNLDDWAQTLILTFAEVTLAVKLLSFALKGLGVSGAIGAAGGLLAGWSVPIAATTAGARTLVSVLGVLPTILGNIGKGIAAAFGGPAAVAIVAAGTAAGFIAREVHKAGEELQTQATMAEGLAKEYDSLTTKMDGMTKGTEEYNEAAKELNTLKGNIASSIPSVIDGYNDETGAIEINRKAMQDLVEAGEELRKSQTDNSKQLDAEIQQLEKERKEHEANAQKYESSQGVLQDLVDRREELTATLAKQSKGSEEAKTTQEALGETERLIADIAQKAGLKRNATVDQIMAKLKELSAAEKQASIDTQITEAEKTQAVINNSYRRLNALSEEIKANKALLPGGSQNKYIPGFLKGKYNYLPGGEGWIRKELSNDQEEAAKVNKELAKTEETYDKQLAAINNSQNALNALKANAITSKSSGGGGTPSSSSSGGGSSSKTDAVAKYLEALSNSAKQFGIVNNQIASSLDSVNNKLSIAGTEYDYLNSKVEDGTATGADYARMQELVAVKSALINDEQTRLTAANEQYRQQIGALTPLLAKATYAYQQYAKAGDADHTEDAAQAVSSLQGEIDNLTNSIAENTQKLWTNKNVLDELTTTTYATYYQQTKAWMQHMDAIGQMNDTLKASVLAGFDEELLTQQQIWELEEEEYQNRLDRLEAERDKIKEAYDERMQQYEDEIDANEELIEKKESGIDSYREGINEQIAAIQKLMDLLDEDAESEDREEAERQHNKKIADLMEERMYHELRTGLEHQESITDIDEQIAEENRSWQLQQNDWAREDQKNAYQDQIDALEKKADAYEASARKEINRLKQTNENKKQEMQKFYNQLDNLLNDSNLRMMAASQENGESFIERMAEIARRATQAFDDNYSVDKVISGAKDLVGDAEDSDSSSGGGSGRPSKPTQRVIASVSAGQYENINGYTYMWSQNLAGLFGKTATWNQSTGTVTIGSKTFTPYKNVNGKTYLGIRQVAEAFGYSVKYDEASGVVTILEKAHTGAYVAQSGAAELLKGERVLSPDLTVSFDRLATAILKVPDVSRIGSGDYSSLERKLDTLIGVMKNRNLNIDKAVNIEHASFEDRAGMQAFGIETRSILTAKG